MPELRQVAHVVFRYVEHGEAARQPVQRAIVERECLVGAHALVGYLQLQQGHAGCKTLHTPYPVVAEEQLLQLGQAVQAAQPADVVALKEEVCEV